MAYREVPPRSQVVYHAPKAPPLLAGIPAHLARGLSPGQLRDYYHHPIHTLGLGPARGIAAPSLQGLAAGPMPGPGQHGLNEVWSKVPEGLAALTQLDQAITAAKDKIRNGLLQVQNTGVASAVTDYQQRVAGAVAGAINDLAAWSGQQRTIITPWASVPAGSANYATTTSWWSTIDGVQQQVPAQIQAVQDALP